MRPRIVMTLIAITGLAAGCSSVRVRTDWDPGVDFSRYSSFAWFERARRPDAERQAVSPLVGRRIEGAVVATLQTAGYREAGVQQADFLVTYHTAIQHKVSVHHVGYAYPSRWRWGWGWGGAHVHHYREGTLVVDVIDRRRRELVWRGVAEGAFTRPDPDEKAVSKVVVRLLAEFPPLAR